jgi:hypothetical protein
VVEALDGDLAQALGLADGAVDRGETSRAAS